MPPLRAGLKGRENHQGRAPPVPTPLQGYLDGGHAFPGLAPWALGLLAFQAEKRLAALRPWPDEKGDYSALRTLEDYWYAWKGGGFVALQPKSRADEGAFRKVSAQLGEWLLSQVSQFPQIPLKVLYLRWCQEGKPLPSLRTLYRFLRTKGYDAASLRRGRLESGPTKAFEAPFVNDLWMTDFSPGPKLHLYGKVLTSQLCLILDDHSRLITFGAYYPAADTRAFHHALKEEDLNISRVRLAARSCRSVLALLSPDGVVVPMRGASP